MPFPKGFDHKAAGRLGGLSTRKRHNLEHFSKMTEARDAKRKEQAKKDLDEAIASGKYDLSKFGSEKEANAYLKKMMKEGK